jgi:hypothetical protein
LQSVFVFFSVDDTATEKAKREKLLLPDSVSKSAAHTGFTFPNELFLSTKTKLSLVQVCM